MEPEDSAMILVVGSTFIPTSATGCGAFESPSGPQGIFAGFAFSGPIGCLVDAQKCDSVTWVFCVRNTSQLVSYLYELNRNLKLAV